jgi:dipeptidyl aminopeptidase/acylaminoacyl peptidase
MRASPFAVCLSVAVAACAAFAVARGGPHTVVSTPGVSRGAAALPRAEVPPRVRPATDEDRVFRLEDLLTLANISDPAWSRDGRRVAFVVSAPDTAENTNNQDLWLADLERGTTSRLTRHPKNDFSPTFSPSGDTLAFVATRGAGDDAKPGIWLMPLRGGDPWSLRSFDESVGEAQWSPDGQWIAYVKLDTLPRATRDWQKKKWDQVIEDDRPQHPRLWVVSAAGGEPRALTEGRDFIWWVRWSPDSKSLAYITSPTGKPDDGNAQDIGVVALSGGPARTLGVIGTSFVWSPDSRWIALATHAHRDSWIEKSDLYVIPAAGGAAANLTASFDEDADQPCWNATSDTLFFHAAEGVNTRVEAVARAGGPVMSGLARNAQSGAMIAGPKGRVVWTQSQTQAPLELWIADHPNLPGRALSAVNDGPAHRVFGVTQPVRWKSSDGVTVEGLLLRPAGAPPRVPLKTLVLLHGGPYTDRYAIGFQGAPQYFAAHGYQVFMPNFRSSGGYGTAFMVRERADWGGQDWRDVMSGLDSLVNWHLVDPQKLGVYGGSYGGYLTAWAITQTDRFDAAAVLAGAVDLPAFYGQSDLQKYRAYEFRGPPWMTPDDWRRSSPITYIRAVKTPTQILIGEADPRVPYPQGQEFYRALRTLGVPTEFVHYPREGHGLREPRHRADQFMRMLAWFDRWIR